MTPGADSEAELIAGVERGLYIQRLWYNRLVDAEAGTVVGTSRDGCFLIEDGRLTARLAGGRFTESVLGALARTDGIGRRLISQPVPNVWNGCVTAPAIRVRGFRFGAPAGHRGGDSMNVATNAGRLVTQVLAGEVWPPLGDRHGFRVDPDGRPFLLPGMGGVTLGVHCGDPATGYAGDHLEPGLSVRHRDPAANYALQFLTCVGNEVVVASGPAAGADGLRDRPARLRAGRHARAACCAGSPPATRSPCRAVGPGPGPGRPPGGGGQELLAPAAGRAGRRHRRRRPARGARGGPGPGRGDRGRAPGWPRSTPTPT